MMNPDKRLITVNDLFVIFFLNNPTPLLKMIHHKVDPQNTPNTKITEDNKLLLAFEIPKPAKIAMNDKMVIGFVSVKNKTDKKAFHIFFFLVSD